MWVRDDQDTDVLLESSEGTASCAPRGRQPTSSRQYVVFDAGSMRTRTIAAERAAAFVAARGPLQVAEIAAEVHPLLGHGWRRGGRAITTRDVEDELRNLAHQLQALDLITRSRSAWSPGPSAHSLLPRANLLADLL